MDTSTFNWSFPGGLWGLSLVAGFVVLIIVLSYALPIRKLNLWAKGLLIAFRLAFLGILLWCLCGPENVRERREETVSKTKIAVVLDESSSMTQTGAKGKSRLAEALEDVRELVRTQGDAAEFKFFAFAEGLRELQNLEELDTPDTRQLKSTNLYRCAAEWAKRFTGDYRAVLCLTDGVDSSAGGRLEEALDALESSAPPHVFRVMTTPLKPKESLEIERLEAPSAVKVGTTANATSVLKCSGFTPSDVLELQVLSEGQAVWKDKVEITSSGTFTKALNFSIPIKTPGSHSFDTVVSCGGRRLASVRWSVTGVESRRLHVLLYMGSLDWGARFMRRTFDVSEHISLDVRYAPDFLGPNAKVKPKNTGDFVQAAELEGYDAVILMDLKRKQISTEMERQLSDYIANGGSLLFLIANTETAYEFANSPVEKFLPALFEQDISAGSSGIDPRTRQFVERMRRYRQGLMMERGASSRDGDLELPPLERFVITEPGLHSGIFDYATKNGKVQQDAIPAFEEFALVKSPKPGAEALAVHPSFNDATGNPRLLLAVQRFGKGRSALMACDPLWRWKMSMDSKSPSYENFWTHLASWLCAGHEVEPHWKMNSLTLEAGKPAEIRFSIPPRTVKFEELEFHSESAGRSSPLLLKPTERPDEFKVEITPAPGKPLTLVAKRAETVIAEASITGGPAPTAHELEKLKPDIPTAKRLAAACDGAVVERIASVDIHKFEPEKGETPVIREETPLWRKASLFVALLALLCGELLVRRAFRLV